MKGLLFDAKTNEFELLETTESNELDTWHDKIGCRCIDICVRKVGGQPFDIVLDDEGLLVEKPILTAVDRMGNPMLAGTLVFYGGHDSEGNLTDITEEGVNLIKRSLARGIFTDGTVKKFIVMEY